MEYMIITRAGPSLMPNWAHLAGELSAAVNAAIRDGWQPLGGMCSCETGTVLMQAMTRPLVVAEEVQA
jgi:hypothetical protein